MTASDRPDLHGVEHEAPFPVEVALSVRTDASHNVEITLAVGGLPLLAPSSEPPLDLAGPAGRLLDLPPRDPLGHVQRPPRRVAQVLEVAHDAGHVRGDAPGHAGAAAQGVSTSGGGPGTG